MEKLILNYLLDGLKKYEEIGLSKGWLELKLKEYISKQDSNILSSYRRLLKDISKKDESYLKYITKNKHFKDLIKGFKTYIRTLNLMFDDIDYEHYLTQLKKVDSTDYNVINELKKDLIKNHISTNERLNYYSKYLKDITEFLDTNKIETVFDLGCGLNPLLTNFNRPYYAFDLNQKSIRLLNEFSKKLYLQNFNATPLDVILEQKILFNIIKKHSNNSVLFLFKALDSFEKIKKNISLELLKTFINEHNITHFVISFANQSLGGNKKISTTKRSWFINFLNKNTDYDITYYTKNYVTEIYYFITINSKK